MTELRPYPFGHLVRRALQELEHEQKLFDLPIAHGFFGDEQLDLSVRMHGQRASSPLGPAAGPHTQMAQNIALSWMAGCRVMELKTVQVNDRLEIARPCIDMQTVGYNIEWSQELRIQESLEEYVKASMLLEILKESQLLPLTSNFGETLFDLSLGYDLKGIRHPTVQAFIDSMGDASAVIDRLRKEIPVELASYRDLDFNVCISNQVTLSTFHGCPPSEIERIAEHLLEEKGLHTIVKLNPTLLGPKRLKEILHGTLGYTEANVPLDAFDEDTHWDEMAAFCERLEQLAQRVELGFGVKFSNTLIVRNHRDFFPKSEERMYLSGAPLHVLATTLVADFREQFGMRFPISFSAGIDRHNFADATAIGLVPVTTCSDLLKTGGYRRGSKYFKSLADRMHAVGALNLGEFSIRAFGLGAQALGQLKGIDPETLQTCQTALDTGTCLRTAVGEVLFEEWVRGAQQLGTQHYASQVTTDPRYALAKNSKLPPKMGRDLKTFDCVACDKCVPVCPNGANFSFRIEPCE
ncbi:MAG: putative selenate reductase, partial [Planctomycetota bacterium]